MCGKVPGEGGQDESYAYPNYPQVLKLMNERKNMTLQVCWYRHTSAVKPKRKSCISTESSVSSLAGGAKKTMRQLTLQP